MSSKKRKKTRPPAPPARGAGPEELLRTLDEALRERRRRYLNFIHSIRHLGSAERATEWLRYVARNPTDFGDQEALVYLRSRGDVCSAEIERVVQDWRREEAEVISAAGRGTPLFTSTGKVKRVRKKKVDPSRIAAVSPFIVRNFWLGSDHQEHTIDATMLRTVEWCGIGGFDGWWERLAKEMKTDILHGGIEPLNASYLLFELSRSPFARSLMGSTLRILLEAIVQETAGHDPWQIMHHVPKRGQLSTQYAFAATVPFASAMLGEEKAHGESIRHACDTLVRGQQLEGWWSAWSFHVRPDIDTTARAVHGLGLIRPRGWERAVNKACEWLRSRQNEEGCWREEASPDSVHLTVLVLDALAVGSGDRHSTFNPPPGARTVARTPASRHKSPRFEVALSFPGEIRTAVARVANDLAGELGRERVFYDDFHQAELARPNLDVYLQGIYHRESRLLVVFLCEAYERKEWCGLEWRAVRDLIKRRQDEKVLFVRVDDAEVPGVFSIDGYLDMRDHTEQEVAGAILDRLRLIELEDRD